MSKYSRSKGARVERQFGLELEKYGVTVKRELGQARDGGADYLIDDLAIQVKAAGRDLQITPWWRQTLNDADSLGYIPVLAVKPDRKPWEIYISSYDVMLLDVERTTQSLIRMTLETFILWAANRKKIFHSNRGKTC